MPEKSVISRWRPEDQEFKASCGSVLVLSQPGTHETLPEKNERKEEKEKKGSTALRQKKFRSLFLSKNFKRRL